MGGRTPSRIRSLLDSAYTVQLAQDIAGHSVVPARQSPHASWPCLLLPDSKVLIAFLEEPVLFRKVPCGEMKPTA